MFRTIQQLRSPGGLIAVLAVLVLAVAALPLFGSTAYAVGLSQQNTVATSRFVIPGGPGTKITTKITAAATAPMLVTVADDISSLFPASGEILISKTELMVYANPGTCSPAPTVMQFCVTARAKVGVAKQHDPPATGTSTDPFNPMGRVKLATQLQATLGTPIQSTMTAPVSFAAAAVLPAKITLASAADAALFGASGELTISHEDTDVGGQSSELMRYTNGAPCSGTLATQLCITVKNLNANNFPSEHKATGYDQPCSASVNAGLTCPHGGLTIVTKHEDVTVKTNGTTGFFPASPLIIYDLSGAGAISNQELVSQVRGAAAAKLTGGPSATGSVFRITNRRDATATYDRTGTVASTHASGSVVTWPDSYLVCRARNEQPGAFAGAGAKSIGSFAACYTRAEPGLPPKTVSPKKLGVPIVGQALVILNALNEPFLSTGGFCHVLYGAVPFGAGSCPGTPPASVDPNGVNDGTLLLTTPCITNFTPGVNLQVNVTLAVDKSFATADTGTIKVRLDTISAAPFAGACDDPVGTGDIILDTYYTGVGVGTDTDGDACEDHKELDNNVTNGGQRDPWNKNDFYDVDGNQAVDIDDVSLVAAAFLTSPPNPLYTAAKDRGLKYGPFIWNVAEANGNIDIDDVSSVAAQFLHSC